MKKIKTCIADVCIIEPKVFGDSRGWFMESWNAEVMHNLGIECNFVQDNHSYSAEKGTLRGLHFQKGDFAQAKIVRCVSGKVLDVAVDLRKSSPSYLKWVAVELSSENKKQLFIPRGCAHGFLTLESDVEFLYKADNFYNKESEGSIRWDDPIIGIKWGYETPFLSEKDRLAPYFDNDSVYFK